MQEDEPYLDQLAKDCQDFCDPQCIYQKTLLNSFAQTAVHYSDLADGSIFASCDFSDEMIKLSAELSSTNAKIGLIYPIVQMFYNQPILTQLAAPLWTPINEIYNKYTAILNILLALQQDVKSRGFTCDEFYSNVTVSLLELKKFAKFVKDVQIDENDFQMKCGFSQCSFIQEVEKEFETLNLFYSEKAVQILPQVNIQRRQLNDDSASLTQLYSMLSSVKSMVDKEYKICTQPDACVDISGWTIINSQDANVRTQAKSFLDTLNSLVKQSIDFATVTGANLLGNVITLPASLSYNFMSKLSKDAQKCMNNLNSSVW